MGEIFLFFESNGVEGITAFNRLKVFDELFIFEVLKKFEYSIASVAFFSFVNVIETAFEEEVCEGDGGSELCVLFDFDDSAEDVVFKFDIHFGIVLIGNVE